ncbi:hypothetical protein [Bacillus paralicheniformis]|uniref:hypothetical protein n=1 Tax=Bacillus paralicheniformis TaxID=1648923 RepID=UPI0012ABFFF5|nr:hypothetical protein [Bacillus paralicheniformis]MBG9882781.1 hypothetical protein [Bacillus paralicheniformis]UAL15350.1 hypothetical protein KY997_05550 [Bacillus paralicheniformis]UJG57525.1 hypothetical protein KY998_23545 [Bacillus paralicheniformis]
MRKSERDMLSEVIALLNSYLEDDKYEIEDVTRQTTASFYTDENGIKQYADDLFTVITVNVSR